MAILATGQPPPGVVQASSITPNPSLTPQLPNQTYKSVLHLKPITVENISIPAPTFDLHHGEPSFVWEDLDVENMLINEELQFAVVGKFSYGMPDFNELKKLLPLQLDLKGECRIGFLESRHILFRLSLLEDYVHLLSRPAFYIKIGHRLHQMRGLKYEVWFDAKEETSIGVAWISFPGLPPVFFGQDSVFSLAKAVGRPLQLDAATKSKSRPSCAKVKVEVDLLAPRPQRLRIGIKNSLNGETKFKWIKIRYDYIPKYCSECKLQGHNEVDCYVIHPDLLPREDAIELAPRVELSQQEPLKVLKSGKIVGSLNKADEGKNFDEKDAPAPIQKQGRQRSNFKKNVHPNRNPNAWTRVENKSKQVTVDQRDTHVKQSDTVATTNAFATLDVVEESCDELGLDHVSTAFQQADGAKVGTRSWVCETFKDHPKIQDVGVSVKSGMGVYRNSKEILGADNFNEAEGCVNATGVEGHLVSEDVHAPMNDAALIDDVGINVVDSRVINKNSLIKSVASRIEERHSDLINEHALKIPSRHSCGINKMSGDNSVLENQSLLKAHEPLRSACSRGADFHEGAHKIPLTGVGSCGEVQPSALHDTQAPNCPNISRLIKNGHNQMEFRGADEQLKALKIPSQMGTKINMDKNDVGVEVLKLGGNAQIVNLVGESSGTIFTNVQRGSTEQRGGTEHVQDTNNIELCEHADLIIGESLGAVDAQPSHLRLSGINKLPTAINCLGNKPSIKAAVGQLIQPSGSSQAHVKYNVDSAVDKADLKLRETGGESSCTRFNEQPAALSCGGAACLANTKAEINKHAAASQSTIRDVVQVSEAGGRGALKTRGAHPQSARRVDKRGDFDPLLHQLSPKLSGNKLREPLGFQVFNEDGKASLTTAVELIPLPKLKLMTAQVNAACLMSGINAPLNTSVRRAPVAAVSALPVIENTSQQEVPSNSMEIKITSDVAVDGNGQEIAEPEDDEELLDYGEDDETDAAYTENYEEDPADEYIGLRGLLSTDSSVKGDEFDNAQEAASPKNAVIEKQQGSPEKALVAAEMPLGVGNACPGLSEGRLSEKELLRAAFYSSRSNNSQLVAKNFEPKPHLAHLVDKLPAQEVNIGEDDELDTESTAQNYVNAAANADLSPEKVAEHKKKLKQYRGRRDKSVPPTVGGRKSARISLSKTSGRR